VPEGQNSGAGILRRTRITIVSAPSKP
jgi:hypothetical protein